MPTFGRDPNPFSSTVRPGGIRPGATPPPDAEPTEPDGPTEAGPGPDSGPGPAPAPVPSLGAPASGPARPKLNPDAAGPEAGAPKRGWLARLNPFGRQQKSGERGAGNARTPAAGRRNPALPAPAQPELSLLSVRVVRNDLSDAEEASMRSRLKGRQLLGRAFPRAVPAPSVRGLGDELPVEPLAARAGQAGQVKLF